MVPVSLLTVTWRILASFRRQQTDSEIRLPSTRQSSRTNRYRRPKLASESIDSSYRCGWWNYLDFPAAGMAGANSADNTEYQ